MKHRIAYLLLLALCCSCHMIPRPWAHRRGPRPPRVPSPVVHAPMVPRVPSPRIARPRVRPPIAHPASWRGWRSPFYRPAPVYVPGPRYQWRPGHAYYPWFWRYRPILEARQQADAEPVEVAAYTAPDSLVLKFGEPTDGTLDDLRGEWVIDAPRSAAVMKAWLEHMLAAYGATDDPDVSELEQDFRKLDARLRIEADGTYCVSLRHQRRSERAEWRGRFTFEEGVLDLGHAADVDGIPVESESAYRFHYYRNDKFTGLVVVNHGLGIVLARG